MALALMTVAAYTGDSVRDGAVAGPKATVEALAWNVDAPHTEVNFSVKHFFTPVTGTFADYEIDLTFDAENPANSSVRVSIDVASINTGNERRDNHLRSGDFFEAEAYPQMTFVSTSVRQTGADQLVALGDLTIKGVTKQIELPITILGVMDVPGEMQQMLGGVERIASFTADAKLNRKDFGVGVGNWAATMVVGGEVTVGIAVEANR
jgi:polyisoprenoid-binding protein YceI